MTTATQNLGILDRDNISKELDLVSELFHRINRIIPENQNVLTVLPTCKVREAIQLMRQYNYSQLPVVENGEVLGVFSYRSFAATANTTLDEWNKSRCAPGDLQVDEFLEYFEFARVTEEMIRVFDAMDRDGGVLIGTPDRLAGVLTPMDFLRYLYQVASPFVLVSEIELALRALIRSVLSEEQIAEAAKRCLASAYKREENVPTELEEMTFDNYQQIVTNGEIWPYFESLFGGVRARTNGKLKEIGRLRNDLFHFKRELTIEDHETLSNLRNWLLNKVKQAEGHRKSEASS